MTANPRVPRRRRTLLRNRPAKSVFLAVLACALFISAPDAPAVAAVPDGFTDELVATGLSWPVGLAFLPDGRLLTTEQFSANVEVLPVGAAITTTVFTVPDVITGSERGLLGIAVDPDWPTRPYLYFNFSHSGSKIYVRMYEVTGDLTNPNSTNLTLVNPYEILTDIPDNAFNHNGGTLRFGPDGMLYVSNGDDASLCNAQTLTSLAGKILRLDVSALPGAGTGPPAKSVITPADNPYPGPNQNTLLLYCDGLRNPFRFHIDPVTGNLYIGDVGQSAWEEIDEAFGGDNFGWPKREGAHNYGGGAGCTGTNGTGPIYEYSRSGFTASVIGGPRYRLNGGSLSFPADYEGDVFLLEYYQGWVRRLAYNEGTQRWGLAAPVPGQPTSENWATGLVRVPELMPGPDGAIYYVTQTGTHSIRRIAGPGATSVDPGLASVANRLTVQPNPWRARGDLTVSFSLSRPGIARLAVYDVAGSLVRTIVDGPQSELNRTVSWDGRASDGSAVPSGVYFLRLDGVGAVSHTEKVTLTR